MQGSLLKRTFRRSSHQTSL